MTRKLFRHYEIQRALALGYWYQISVDSKAIIGISLLLIVLCGWKVS